MIETAVVIAVLLSMLMGVYSVSQFASDQNTAGTATRAGARLASELGNGNYSGAITSACQANAQDPCALDRQIVQVVCQIAATMPFVTSIDEVDIYLPTRTDGQQQAGDLVDQYKSCTPGAGPTGAATYGLDDRIQTHPLESFIGVSVTYHYKSPTPLVPLATQPTVFTVVQLSPHFT
jgi:hypothetical protein